MKRYPTVTTKIVILLGNPLGHSVSPPMHNAVFEKFGMDFCYMPVEVTENNLETVFNGLAKMNVAGFNVTIPHKISIMNYLDELDPLAKTIGAVNTVRVRDGKTKGYNTDGKGFVRSLEEESGTTIKGKTIFILGAGGAARAISMTLAFEGAETIFIQNRTEAKAAALVTEINSEIRACSKTVKHNETSSTLIESCDVLINCTSLGMHPNDDTSPIDKSLLSPNLTVADIVYNPLTTTLLRDAQEIGCTTVAGLGMLINQGAEAFEIFTDIQPDIDTMTQVAYSLMESRGR